MKRMNDRGVSPVVGTIILIAITVIVAGTIAYYATGIGTPEDKPTVNVTFDDVQDGEDKFYINHTGGDSVDTDDLSVKVDGADWSEVNDGNDTFEVGDQLSFEKNGSNGDLSSGERIVLSHDPSGTALATTTVD